MVITKTSVGSGLHANLRVGVAWAADTVHQILAPLGVSIVMITCYFYRLKSLCRLSVAVSSPKLWKLCFPRGNSYVRIEPLFVGAC
jgi:hypothetical protein